MIDRFEARERTLPRLTWVLESHGIAVEISVGYDASSDRWVAHAYDARPGRPRRHLSRGVMEGGTHGAEDLAEWMAGEIDRHIEERLAAGIGLGDALSDLQG